MSWWILLVCITTSANCFEFTVVFNNFPTINLTTMVIPVWGSTYQQQVKPMYTVSTDQIDFKVIDSSIVLIPPPLPPLSDKWNVLVVRGIHNAPSVWDAVIAEVEGIPGSIVCGNSCNVELVNNVLKCGDQQVVMSSTVTISGSSFPLIKSYKIFQKSLSICVISIYHKIAHFDNPIDWLQAKVVLCRQEMDWVLIVTTGELDIDVKDLLEGLLILYPGESVVLDSESGKTYPSGVITRREPGNTDRKIISKTKNFNIYFSIFLSAVAGLVISGSWKNQRHTLYEPLASVQ